MVRKKIINDIIQKLIDKYNKGSFEVVTSKSGEQSLLGCVAYKYENTMYNLMYTETKRGNDNTYELIYGIINKQKDCILISNFKVDRSIRESDFKPCSIQSMREDIICKSR